MLIHSGQLADFSSWIINVRQISLYPDIIKCVALSQDICFIWIVGIFSLCSQISILSSSTRFTSIRQVFEIFMKDPSSGGASGLLKFNGSSKLFRGAVKILHNNVCVQKWRENDIKFSSIPRSNNWEMKLGDQGSNKLLPRVGGVWIPILYSWNIASQGWGLLARTVHTISAIYTSNTERYPAQRRIIPNLSADGGATDETLRLHLNISLPLVLRVGENYTN